MASLPADQEQPTLQTKRVAIASLVGSAVEWYDYFIFGTSAALVFGGLFFPSGSEVASTLAALATFAVGFVARPVGGVIIGHFGDRVGRKAMLILSLVGMGLGTFLIAFLPTFQAIGVWAPTLLVGLRLLQGLAIGGEWGGAVLIVAEHAPPKRRGFYTSVSQMGVSVGLVSGIGVMYALAGVLSEKQFLAWGWRIPFLVSALLIGIGFYVRLKISDSPAFRRIRETGTRTRLPLGEVLRHFKKTTLQVICMQAAVNVCFYMFATYSVTYASQHLGLATTTALVGVLIAASVDFLTIPAFARLSDRIGRRAVTLTGSAFFGVFAFPFFLLMNTRSITLITIALVIGIAGGHAATQGVLPTSYAELFGTRVRYSGVSLGYQLAGSIWSGPTPFIAGLLLASVGSWWAIAVFMIFASLVSVTAIYLSQETARTDISEESPWSRSRQGAKA